MEEVLLTIKPFYYPTKYLGFLPFNITHDGVKVFSIKVIPVVVMFLLNLLNHWYRFSVTLNFTTTYPVLLNLGVYMTFILFLLNTITMFVKSFINRLKFHELLVKFVKVDEKILRLGMKLNYRRQFMYSLAAVSVLIAGFLFIFAVTLISNQTILRNPGFEIRMSLELLMFGGTLLSAFSASSYIGMFCMIVLGVRERYKAVNKILSERKAKISHVARVNLDINEIVMLINDTFGFIIAGFAGTILVSLIFLAFHMFIVINRGDLAMSHSLYISFIWNILMMAQIFLVISACVKAEKKGNKIREILQTELNQEVIEEKVKNKLKIFILQLKHLEAKFSCGYFDFDWKLMATVRKVFNDFF